jgi:hypothetical protein
MTANTSEAEVSVVEEATWGTIPANPPWQRVRVTGEGLVYDIENVTSEEITPEADVTDEVQVGAQASGPLNFELTFGDADTGLLLAHALRASWVAGVAADDMEELKAGTEKKSLSIEKKFVVTGGDDYSRYSGMVANTLNLTVEEKRIVTGSIEFLGKGEATGTAALAGATYAAANIGKPIAAPDVAAITVGGVSGTVYYKSLGFTLNNNCAVRSAVGSKDAIGVRYGRREIEGTIIAYFDADTRPLYDRFVAGTESTLSFDLVDEAGDTYHVIFPRIKYRTGRKVAGANNEDVVAEMSFRALRDPVTGCAIQINRTAAGA